MGPHTALPETVENHVEGTDAMVREHSGATVGALQRSGLALERCAAWGRRLADILPAGARLLVCGNGGSAAQGQLLTAELIGRFHVDRPANSAISLDAGTAIGNDYGGHEMFARQVAARGRPGDVLMLLSTSGRSPNLLAAAECAKRLGISTWALTGPAPNPLSRCVQESASIPSSMPSAIQGVHLVAVHVLCTAFDEVIGGSA